jgi:hypothetical protein
MAADAVFPSIPRPRTGAPVSERDQPPPLRAADPDADFRARPVEGARGTPQEKDVVSILNTGIRNSFLVREMGLTPFQVGLLSTAVLAEGPVTPNSCALTVLIRGLEWCAEVDLRMAEEARGLIETITNWSSAQRERVLGWVIAFANMAGGGRGTVVLRAAGRVSDNGWSKAGREDVA